MTDNDAKLQATTKLLSLIETVDRVVVDEEAQKHLIQWRDEHKELVRHSRPTLESGVIEYSWQGKNDTLQRAWQYFSSPTEEKSGIMVVYVRFKDTQNYVPAISFQFDWDMESGEVRVGREWRNTSFAFGEGEDAPEQSSVTMYCTVMAYMQHYTEVRDRVHRETRSILYTKKAKHGKKGNRTVRASRVEYRLPRPTESLPPSESRSYERHVGSWGVRGHLRTYKSGKTVFIPPHTKGQGAHEAKDYRV